MIAKYESQPRYTCSERSCNFGTESYEEWKQHRQKRALRRRPLLFSTGLPYAPGEDTMGEHNNAVMTECDECGYTDVRLPNTDCPICDDGMMLV